jgi:cytochrome c oxidase cbb3-type subunit 3
MKFKNYLENIADVGIYPMASLLIFFIFFTLLAIWALRANKQYIDHMKNIPIGTDDNNL